MKIAPISITNQYETKLNSSGNRKENVSNVSLNNQSVPNFKANPELTKKALGTIEGMLKKVPDDAVEKLLVSFGGIVATLGLSVEKQAIETKEIKTKEMPFINTQDNNGKTQLIRAVENGDLEKVKDLCQYKKLDPNIQNRWGNTALIGAAQKGHTEIVEELLKLENIDPNIKNENGYTALISAAAYGHTEIVKLLKEFQK